MAVSKNAQILWRTFKKYRFHLGILVVLGFLSAILEGIGINAAIPLLSFLLGDAPATDPISSAIRSVFEFFSVGFSFRTLLIFVVTLFMLRAVSTVVFGYIRGWITADFLYQETHEALRRTLFASWPYLLRQKLGVMQATLIRDVQRTSGLLAVLSQAIQSFTGFFIYLIVALNISPLMTLYTVLGGAVLLLVVRPFLSRTRGAGEAMAVTEKQITQFISEHIIGMKAVKAAGAEARAFVSGNTFLQSLRRLQIRMALLLSLSTSMFQPFTIIFVIVLFALTYQQPGFNLISFAATLYLIQKIFTYLESGQSSLHIISELIPYAQNLATFKDDLTAHAETERPGNVFVFRDALRFEQVSFAYPESGAVLSSVSFDIKKGSTTALIGPSGGGKTSLADLLLRLFEPTEGQILLDNAAASTIGLSQWRESFGYVSQDVFLFNGTIEDNIRFYRDSLSEADIHEAARQANIYDYIMSLPEGFKTTTGDRGVMLSGGQRQRVVLARALAGRPEVLVLDEATSALDQESEALIQASIKNLHGKVTVFIIAHRLSTVENADSILVLEGGKLVEQGSPKELLATPTSYFARHHSNKKL